MSYGFFAKNDSDYVQIDGDYSNLVALMSGSITYTPGQYAVIPYQLNENIPALIFIRSDNTAPYWITFVYNNQPSIASLDSSATEGTIIDYIVAVQSDILTIPDFTNKYGLNVFRADGSLAFSTEFSTIQVRAAFLVTTNEIDVGSTKSYTGPSLYSGTKRYFCITALPATKVMIYGNGTDLYSYVGRVSGTRLVLKHVKYFDGTNGTSNLVAEIPYNNTVYQLIADY